MGKQFDLMTAINGDPVLYKGEWCEFISTYRRHGHLWVDIINKNFKVISISEDCFKHELSMAPKLVKKEYWANKYRDRSSGKIHISPNHYLTENNCVAFSNILQPIGTEFLGAVLIHSEEVAE